MFKTWEVLKIQHDIQCQCQYIPCPSSRNSVIVTEVHLDHGLEASMLVKMEDISLLSSMEPKFSSQNLESSWESPRRCPLGTKNNNYNVLLLKYKFKESIFFFWNCQMKIFSHLLKDSYIVGLYCRKKNGDRFVTLYTFIGNYIL